MTDVERPLLQSSTTAASYAAASYAAASYASRTSIRRKYYRQHIVSLLANISVICNGVVLGWSSPAETVIKHSMTSTEWVWTSALAPLGAVFGAIPAGILADRIGRRDALLTTALPSLIGWFLITFTQAPWAAMFGRTLVGIAMGASTVVVPLYSDETASERIRGIVGVYLDMSLTIGILISYVVGGFWSYEALNVFGCILPLVFALTFVWMPETPRYLKSKGRLYESEEVYGWLRGRDFSMAESARHTPTTPGLESTSVGKNDVSLKDTSSTITRSGSKLKDTEDKKANNVHGDPPAEDQGNDNVWPKNATIRGVTIVYLLMIFEQLSGICGIIFYAERIFTDSSSSIAPNMAALIVGIAEVLATMSAAALVDRLGRRPLLGISAGMMTASLVSLASCVWLPAKSSARGWLPVLSVCIYIVFFSVGFGPLPWFMMAELLPPQTKAWAAPGAVAINWFIVFAVTVGFEPALEVFGQQTTYFGLAIICGISLLFVILFVPETIKLSPDQIRTMVVQGRLYYKAPRVERQAKANGVRETSRL